MKFVKYLFISVAMLMMVSSCSKVEDKIESQIPADALVVMKVDVPQLIEHSGIEVKGGKVTLPPKIKQLMAENSDEAKEIEDNMGELQNSGIDMTHSFYLFVPDNAINENSENMDFVALFPVKDDKKLTAYFKDKLNATFSEKDGMKIATNEEDGFFFALKDDILCITTSMSDNPQKKLLSLISTDNNMTKNDEIVKALDGDYDVNIYVNSKKFKKFASKQAENLNGPESMAFGSVLDIVDVQSTALHLSLADNEWTIKSENNFGKNSDYEKLVEMVAAKPDADLLAMMPTANNAAVFSISLKGEKVAEMDIVKKFLDQAQGDPEFTKIIDVFKSINGPIVVGFAADELNPEKANVVFAMKCDKANQLPSFVGSLPFAEAMTRNGDEYLISQSPSDPKMALGFKDKVLYFKISSTDNTATMSNVGDVKSLFANSVMAFYFTSKVDNMQMQMTMDSKDMKNGETKLWVTENGKKLNPLDALTFFVKLQEQTNAVSFTE